MSYFDIAKVKKILKAKLNKQKQLGKAIYSE